MTQLRRRRREFRARPPRIFSSPLFADCRRSAGRCGLAMTSAWRSDPNRHIKDVKVNSRRVLSGIEVPVIRSRIPAQLSEMARIFLERHLRWCREMTRLVIGLTASDRALSGIVMNFRSRASKDTNCDSIKRCDADPWGVSDFFGNASRLIIMGRLVD